MQDLTVKKKFTKSANLCQQRKSHLKKRIVDDYCRGRISASEVERAFRVYDLKGA